MTQSTHPVDEHLPTGKLAALGLQHVLVMYAGAVAVPLIVFVQLVEVLLANTVNVPDIVCTPRLIGEPVPATAVPMAVGPLYKR